MDRPNGLDDVESAASAAALASAGSNGHVAMQQDGVGAPQPHPPAAVYGPDPRPVVYGPEPAPKPQPKPKFLEGPFYRPFPKPPPEGGVDDPAYQRQLSKCMDDIRFLNPSIPVGVAGGEYGVATVEGLVPLPFPTTVILAYVWRCLLGFIQVAISLLVLFTVVTLQNERLLLRAKSSNYDTWVDVLKAAVIVYPVCVMTMLTNKQCEVVLRNFMYYRLLSLRILIDFENRPAWRGIGFWVLLVSLALINAWAIYGIVVLWNVNGTGADAGSWTAWAIVNMQSLQLLFLYMRLDDCEAGLITMNQFVEGNPDAAKLLIDYTYVVPERALRSECLRCQGGGCCGGAGAPFDVENLKACAVNRARIDANIGVERAVCVPDKRRGGGCCGGGGVMRPLYATQHAWYLSCCGGKRRAWPFQQDVPYMRTILLLQLLGMAAVAGVLVYAILTTQVYNQTCTQGNRSCIDCFNYYREFVGVTPPVCKSPGYNITRAGRDTDDTVSTIVTALSKVG